MFCPSCGTAARPAQKFCMECGTDLRTVSPTDDDATTRLPSMPDEPVDADATTRLPTSGTERPADEDDGGPITGEIPVIQTSDDPITVELRDEVARASGHRVDPMIARPPGVERPAADRAWSATGQTAAVATDPDATTRLPTTAATPAAAWQDAPTRVNTPAVGYQPADHTQVYERPYADHALAPEAEPWDWSDAEPARVRPRRRLRLVLLPALLAVAGGVVAVTQILIEIVPGAGAAGFDTGTWMVNDFGTNNTVAAIAAMSAILLGAVLWCLGFRWGAGLAGGGGLALTGWAALMIGLAEWPLADAERVAGNAVELTRDVGYFGLVAAGAAGVLTFLASLTGAGRDPQGGLDPWIAALGAASVLVAAGGPLIPLGTADITGNYDSATLAVDLPQLFFAGRLTQLGLLAFTGIIGFLLVRRFGLGLAIGGATAAGVQLATAALRATDSPIGPGYGNPGVTADLTPHGVTVVGMALAGFFALVAVVMALFDRGVEA